MQFYREIDNNRFFQVWTSRFEPSFNELTYAIDVMFNIETCKLAFTYILKTFEHDAFVTCLNNGSGLFTNFVTRARVSDTEYLKWLSSFYNKQFNFHIILLWLKQGKIDFVRHIVDKIDTTEHESIILSYILNDDIRVLHYTSDWKYDVSLSTIALECNLINIFQEIPMGFDTNPTTITIQSAARQIPVALQTGTVINLSNEMIDYILTRLPLSEYLIARIFNKDNLKDYIHLFDSKQLAFIYYWLPECRDLVSTQSINIDELYKWLSPPYINEFLNGNVDFNWLESQGFDFYKPPMAILPSDESNIYRNSIAVNYLLHNNYDNDENLNVLDTCIHVVLNVRSNWGKIDLYKLHNKLVNHLFNK